MKLKNSITFFNTNIAGWIKVLSKQWVAILATIVTGLLLNILIARAIGPEEFGLYSIALTFASFAIILIDGGFGRLLQREITLPSLNIEKHKLDLHSYAIAHAFISIFILLPLALLFYSHYIVPITLVYFFLVAINGFSLAVLRGNGELIKDANWQTYYRLGLFIIVCSSIFLLKIHSALSVVLAYLVAIFLFVLFVSKAFIYKPNFKIPSLIYQAVIPLVVIDLMATIYLKSDILILNYFGISKYEIGHYSVAFKFVELFIFLIAPLNLILFRKLRTFKNAPYLISKKLFFYITLTLFFSFLIAIFLFVFAESIMVGVFGGPYQSAAHFLKIFALVILFVLPNSVMNQMLFAFDLELSYAWIVVFAAISNILLNIIYLPIYGIVAAAWISVIIEIFIFVLFTLVLLRFVRKQSF